MIAGCPEQLCSGRIECLTGLYGGSCAVSDEIRKEMTTHAKLGLREIVTVEIQEIEGQELCRRRFLARSAAERGLQEVEIAPPLLVVHDRFAVDDRGRNAQRPRSFFYFWKAAGSVVAAFGQDPDPGRLNVDGDPVTVPLDFIGPALAFRRLRLQQGKARLHTARHRIEQKVRLRRIPAAPRLRPCRSVSVLEQRFRTRWLRRQTIQSEKR